jgi:hypothetical protein
MTNSCSEQLKDWIELFQENLSELKLLGAPPWDQLMKDILVLKREIQDMEDARKEISPLAYDLISPIERLGLGPKIISLYEGGLEAVEISNHLAVMTSTTILPEAIQNYINNCNESGLRIKARLLGRDVFDSRTQMQGLLEQVVTSLEELKQLEESVFARNAKSKPEIVLQYYDSVRSLLKDAHQMQKDEEAFQRAQQFADIAMEVIREVAPEAGLELFKRLRARKIMLISGVN